MPMDLRVMELLSSKICHDLISPVSAINNGVELIEDIGGDVVDEAMNLIAASAIQASRRLRVFRIAYGRAGSEENMPVRDVHQVMTQYFEGTKIKLLWTADLTLPDMAEKHGALKVLINMMIMAEEALAYGGAIALEPDEVGCRLVITGRNAQLSAPMIDALFERTPIEDLTPRTIQAYMTGLFAARFGFDISFESPKEEHLFIKLGVRNSGVITFS